MKKKAIFLLILFCATTIFGCAALEDTNTTQPDYEDTKRMVVDMLQTEEGKKAIQEVLKEDEVKEELIMEQEFIKDTIEQTLASEEGKTYWQELMKDPEFAKTFAESLQEENEQLLKGLMKDPEYQSMMIEILSDPEMEEHYVELTKSKDYRKEIQAVVTQAMESPLFVARVNDLLKEIAKQELKSPEPAEEGSGEEEEGGGEGGGEEGGGSNEGEDNEEGLGF
ncbi:spore germination lipoprotein GerD [Salipaludibacillus daqingensis]|uniref:spore germination lipoprotein GerD n=1 Tax=Salipaludibacillus daqingensis TaxID=3041001 RepID=UPI0024742DCD|nr:spore germination lipoprotein GerD [Salipaludibacillus daqingensis]